MYASEKRSESSNTPVTTNSTNSTNREGKMPSKSYSTPATINSSNSTREEEFQIQKELSKDKIENAQKLRKRGPKLLAQMIDAMMNAELVRLFKNRFKLFLLTMMKKKSQISNPKNLKSRHQLKKKR